MTTSTPELASGSLTRVRVGAVDGGRVRVETDVTGPSMAPAETTKGSPAQTRLASAARVIATVHDA